MSWMDSALEKGVLPDPLVRFGIRRLLRQRLAEIDSRDAARNRLRYEEYLRLLRSSPIAVNTRDANEQHYEVPTEFFRHCLGPRMKYSCGYYPDGNETLAEAEEKMLALTCARADLRDGHDILELGCGWGSLTLWMAEKYPRSRITAVSNSRTQKEWIDSQLAARGWSHVRVITCDMNHFEAEAASKDRVVSVEMFEHMRNYEALLARIAGWLRPEGRLFVHIFVHREFPYLFEARDESDWMSRYFFTGGQMPSDGLLREFQGHLKLIQQWRVDGRHYQATAEDWLRNMDRNSRKIGPLLASAYGRGQARKWRSYWRIFYMACAELWGFAQGREWFVSHYLFEKPGLE